MSKNRFSCSIASGILAIVLCAPLHLYARSIDIHCNGNVQADTNQLLQRIAASAPGDFIRIHGVCNVNQTVVLFSDRTYEGDSRTGTVIRQADNANLPALLASDSWANDSSATGSPVRIAHMTLDGNKASNMDTHALVIRSWLTVIEDMEIRNAPGDGIRLTNK